MTDVAIKRAAILEAHGPQAIILPPEERIDDYLQALEWRRAIIERIAGWEEMAALEKIHRAKAEMLSQQVGRENSNLEAWQELELEGKLERELAAARCCRMRMEQYEKETRAWHMKMRTMLNQADESRNGDGVLSG